MRLLVSTAIICTLCSAARAQESNLARVISADAPGAAVVWLPDGISSGMFAWRIAECARVPLIFEASPLEYRDPATVAERVDLAGLTVREALDILVAHDPRYAWEERAGVIVIRPSSLAGNPEDMLNRRIAAMTGSRVDLNGVLARVTGSDSAQGGYVRPAVDSKVFAIDAPSGPILDVLVSAARAHGGVMWTMPDTMHGPERGAFSLGYRTFRHAAVGTCGSGRR
jgi:hypothetical protein